MKLCQGPNCHTYVTTDIDIADDKLRGYILINTNPKESYTILKHEKSLVLTEEMRVA